jgi:selenocysteine lyase/cysteine desulfurase
MPPLDLAALRADTPGIATGAIHLNAAGAALPPAGVLAATVDFLTAEATLGGYEAVEARAADLARPYAALARLLGCERDDVAICASATAAWRAAFSGVEARLPTGAVLLAVAGEYGSNAMALLAAAERVGGRVVFLPDAPGGRLDTAALAAALATTPPPALLSLTHVPTSSGRVYDAEQAAAAAAEAGVPFLLDATQSVGQLPVALPARPGAAAWIVGTSRKYLRGPRGVGFVAASPAARAAFPPVPPDVWGGAWEDAATVTPAPPRSARCYEQYELAMSAKAGLGAAVEYLLDAVGVDAAAARTASLAAAARTALAAVRGVTVRNEGATLCGIVSFTVDGVEAETVKAALRLNTPPICVAVSPANSSRVDFDARGLTAVVRASFHYYNGDGGGDALARAVAGVAAAAGGVEGRAQD